MKKSGRLLSLLLVAAIIFTMFIGCKKREETPSQGSSSTPASSSSSKPSSKPTSDKTVASVLPGMVKYVTEKKELNSDTVGWLQIGSIGIDDVVVCNKESNQYYNRLNFEKQYDFNGVFFADRRSDFGEGSADELGINTCIYGHALTDEKDHKNYSIKFAPLHDFRDPEIAKEIPYIFFTTEKEDLAFEVISVFVVNAEMLPYNTNNLLSPEEFRTMVKDEILPRSIYNYDVEIKDDDKFLTLSTCIYTLPNGTPTHYPDTYYRYVIMGRLVKPGEPLKTEASFTVNENPVVDPDTFKK